MIKRYLVVAMPITENWEGGGVEANIQRQQAFGGSEVSALVSDAPLWCIDIFVLGLQA